MKKMTVKKARKTRDTLMIVGFLIALLAYIWEPMIYVGAVTMFSSFIPHFLYNKCPHCGRQLGRNEGDFCQFCGEKLSD